MGLGKSPANAARSAGRADPGTPEPFFDRPGLKDRSRRWYAGSCLQKRRRGDRSGLEADWFIAVVHGGVDPVQDEGPNAFGGSIEDGADE